MTFELLPSIDLRGGRVVRLRRGDFGAEIVYDTDPVAAALRLVEAGAQALHVVDLDGARAGEPMQAAVVKGIVDAVGERAVCQVAGGLRTRDAVAKALDTGAGRVVVGTAALIERGFAGALVATHGPDSVVVALDVRDGMALGEGWRPGAFGLPVEVALLGLSEAGVSRFAVTGVDRDGLLEGPDLALFRRLVAFHRGSIVASGGISSLADLEAVKAIGCTGAIVGRAIYEGRIEVAEAIRVLGT